MLGAQVRHSHSVQPAALAWHGVARPLVCTTRAATAAAAASNSARTQHGLTPVYAAAPPPQAVLDRYRAMLGEYRAHKAALAGWLHDVAAAQRRPAGLLDAEATGDAALLARCAAVSLRVARERQPAPLKTRAAPRRCPAGFSST